MTGARSIGLLFTDREAFRTIDLFRLLYAVTAVVAFFVTEAGRNVYRPYIYEHGINDLGIADSMGNLGGIVVQIFFGLGILNSTRIQSIRMAAFFSVGYVLYEFAQPYLPRGVFDWKDACGTAIGFAISVLLILTVWRVVGSGCAANGHRGAERDPIT